MTIKEIAQLAGVSVSTVSKIVNQNDDSISAATRTKVLEIVKKYNYMPYSSVSRGSAKTFLLGILVRSLDLAGKTLEGIMGWAEEKGYICLILESRDDPKRERKHMAALTANRVDGIIWEPIGEALPAKIPPAETSMAQTSMTGTLDHLNRSKIPYITWDALGKSSYSIDYGKLAYYATELLIKAGHRDIACCFQAERDQGFLDGYRQCLYDYNLLYQEECIFDQLDDKLFYKLSTHSISAVVSASYQTALALYEKAAVLRRRTPDDFSLVSLRRENEGGSFPYISSVPVPEFQFGQYLCGSLVGILEKDSMAAGPFVPRTEISGMNTIAKPFFMRTKKIAVVGSVNMDIYLTFRSLPRTGKAVSTSLSASYPGGKGANQAIGAAKLGHRVSMVGRVGNDIESERIYAAMKENAIDCSNLRRSGDTDTGKAYIFVEEKGESMISLLSGANGQLTEADIMEDKHMFDQTAYCLISTEIPMEAVRAACREARRRGVKTVVKPSTCPGLDDETLKNIDILVPNFEEINELYPCDLTLSERADYFLNKGVGLVIITLGAEGGYVKGQGIDEYFPAVEFLSIDNTGAGDAFICTLASYLLYGYDLRKAIRIASYASGFCISRQGVVPSLIDKNTLEAYIRQKEPSILEISPETAR